MQCSPKMLDFGAHMRTFMCSLFSTMFCWLRSGLYLCRFVAIGITVHSKSLWSNCCICVLTSSFCCDKKLSRFMTGRLFVFAALCFVLYQSTIHLILLISFLFLCFVLSCFDLMQVTNIRIQKQNKENKLK